MKIFVIVAALVFAVPLVAVAQPVPENDSTAQKVQQTYHNNYWSQTPVSGNTQGG